MRQIGVDDESEVVPARPGFRRDIQGLRAAAVLIVVLYHAGFGLPGGFVGVDVFFVISGFVIGRGLLHQAESEGRIDLRAFFRRRVVRILPAASLAIGVVLLALPLLGPFVQREFAAQTGLSAALFNANHYLAFRDPGSYFSPTTEMNPFLHMWSLSVEEQFYFVFPFVFGAVALAASRDKVRTRLLSVLSILFITSLVASLIAIDRWPEAAFYLAPLRAWEFLAGALLVWVEPKRLSRGLARTATSTGALVLLATALIFDASQPFPGWRAIVPVAATALLITGSPHARGPITRALGSKIAGYFGDVSYAWYLWHWPLIVFARATFPNADLAVLVAVVLSLAIATASTRLFEEPIRSSPAFRRRPLAVLGVGLAASAGAMAIGGMIAEEVSQTPDFLAFREEFRLYDAGAENCSDLQSPRQDCVAPNPGATKDVLLVGDSTALQLFDGLKIAAEEQNYNAQLAYRSFCGSNRYQVFAFGETNERCVQFWDEVDEHIAADPPDVAVVVVALSEYIGASHAQLRVGQGEWISDPEIRSGIVQDAITDTLGEFVSNVDRVVYVGTTPDFGRWQPAECSFAVWSRSPDSCAPPPLDWDDITVSDQRSVGVEAEVRSIAGLEFVDLSAHLCPGDECGARIDGQWLFRDTSHITVGTSERLAPLLSEILAER